MIQQKIGSIACYILARWELCSNFVDAVLNITIETAMPLRSLDDALNAIRTEHDKGKALLGKEFDEHLLEKDKVLLRKRRHFADPITGYSDAELEELLQSCRDQS